MHHGVRPGDVLADRYLLVDLLTESGGGRFWRAHDRVLARHVALHVLPADDRRAPELIDAARRSATVTDRRVLRVLDAEERDGLCFVVNEWGTGRSLDIILATEGPLSPRRAAWVVREAAAGLTVAHSLGVPHGHLIPENLLVDRSGAIRLIGFSVDAALRGLEPSAAGDVRGLAALLYAALTGRWPGPPPSQVPEAPRDGVSVLRPRQVRAGIPRALDVVCDEVLNPAGTHLGGSYDAARLTAALDEVVGDDSGMVAAEAARHRTAMDTRPPAPPAAWPDRPTGTTVNDETRVAAPLAVPVTVPTSARVDSPLHPAATLAPTPEPEQRHEDGEVVGEPVEEPTAPPAPGRHRDPVPAATTVTQPVEPVEPVTEPVTTAEPEPTTEPVTTTEPEPAAEPVVTPEPEEPEPAAPVDDPQPGPPTEAGMPIFDDEADEVEWLRHRTETPAPPPPFEEPPERPLFAPGPPDDARTARGRQEDPSRAGGSGTFWPWETGVGGPGAPLPAVPDEDEEEGPVPGRRSLALGVTLIVVILVAIGGVLAYNAGRDGGSGDDTPGPTGTEQQAAPPEPLPIDSVTDLDPQGDPPEENPDLAPLAADGDPTTAWRTSTYAQQLGPGGLKTGLGLVVDLGEFRDVAAVRVEVAGETALAAYVADTEPTNVADLTRVAEATGDGTVDLELAQPDTGRFVVVWIDRLPAVSDGFRAEVAEISVLG